MPVYCSACCRQIADDALFCPGSGHALAAGRRGRFLNVWLLLAVFAASALHSVFSPTGGAAYDVGPFLGNILGSILFAGLIYPVFWLVHGRKRDPHGNRFVLMAALVIGHSPQ